MCVVSQTHGEPMSLKQFSTQLEIQCLYVGRRYLILFHAFFLSANYTVFIVLTKQTPVTLKFFLS